MHTDVSAPTAPSPASKGRRWPAYVLGLGLLWLGWCWHTAATSSPLGLLNPDYHDPLRHMRYVQLFLHEGFGIYGHPMATIEHYGDPRIYDHPQSSYPYPPGALLLFAPFSLLLFGLQWPLELVFRLVLMTLLAFHHAATGLLLADRSEQDSDDLAFIALFYYYGLIVAMNSQYEVVPLCLVFLAARAARRGDVPRQLLLMSGAVFLKFNFLQLLPFYVSAAWTGWKQRQLWIQPRTLVRSAWVYLLLLSLLTLWLGSEFVATAQVSARNSLAWRLLPVELHTQICYAVSLLCAAWAALEKRWGAAACVLFFLVSMASAPIVQAWYLLQAFMFAPFFSDRRSRVILQLYAIAFLWGYGAIPEPLAMVEQLRLGYLPR